MSVTINKLLEVNPDSIQCVKKEYNLEDPKRMDEAIDILEDWIKKQSHFTKKDFPRKYLETNIISNKGSIERTKSKLEKLCTLKTIFPHFYNFNDIKKDFKNVLSCATIVPLPKLTKDNYRLFSVTLEPNETFYITPYTDYYKMYLIYNDYLKIHDYSSGHHYVLDYRNINILDIVSKVNLMEIKQLATLILDGYGIRIKGIHFLTPSKTIENLLKIVKPLFPAKIAERFQVHSTLESLYKLVPKDTLALEFGGPERSVKDLQNDWIELLSSEESMNFLNWIKQVGVIDSYRLDEKNNEYAGLSGTFRSLNVD